MSATVPVPPGSGNALNGIADRAQDGTFFIAALTPGLGGARERLYRFQLTSTGQVTGFAAVPGGVLAGRNWTADAMAASVEQVAVSTGSR